MEIIKINPKKNPIYITPIRLHKFDNPPIYALAFPNTWSIPEGLFENPYAHIYEVSDGEITWVGNSAADVRIKYVASFVDIQFNEFDRMALATEDEFKGALKSWIDKEYKVLEDALEGFASGVSKGGLEIDSPV